MNDKANVSRNQLNDNRTDESGSEPSNDRIEVSGWEADNSFFVEKTDLFYAPDGHKQVTLHRPLPQGSLVFVRSLVSQSMKCSTPVAYQVQEIRPFGGDGLCEMRLCAFHPRLKAPNRDTRASYCLEDAPETRASLALPGPEEVLQ